MNVEESKIDALYEIAREIKQARIDIVDQLKSIRVQLEDISAGIASISNDMPKIEDHE